MQSSCEWSTLLSFSDKETPMTLQIGMIARDGFAIVGDTWKHLPPQRRAWFGYSGPKMFMSASGKSMAAIARTVEISTEAAKEVFDRLEGQTGDKADSIAEIGSRIAQDHEIEFFAVFTDPIPEMYFFQKEKAGRARCERMYGCYPIGDGGNPAYYWIMRYADLSASTEQLVKIAAQAVITGAKLNNAMIQGLEVATFDSKGLRIWERAESEALKAEVEAIDEKIGSLLCAERL